MFFRRNQLLLLSILFLCGCDPQPGATAGQVMAYVPVYAPKQDINNIALQPVRPTTNAGKIYVYGRYIFQVEQQEGIHIIDNATPAQARKISFLKIPYCTEMAIRNNYLYTNNLNDLVVFNLADINNPQLVSRIAGAFPAISQAYPPFSNVMFECPDPSKGIVVRWDQKTIATPGCRR